MQIIDVSHEIADGTVTYPGLPGPVIDDHLSWDASHNVYAPGTEFQIGRIEMVANTGTYLDTPAHRWRDGFDLSGLPLESVANLEMVIIDVPEQAAHRTLLDGIDVRNKAVPFRTGWSQHWNTERYGDATHPYVSRDSAAWLVEHGTALVGIDSVNIDDTGPESNGERPIHSTLLRANIPIVEHLCNLEAITSNEGRFFAIPPRVKGMATFPVRAFAIVES